MSKSVSSLRGGAKVFTYNFNKYLQLGIYNVETKRLITGLYVYFFVEPLSNAKQDRLLSTGRDRSS